MLLKVLEGGELRNDEKPELELRPVVDRSGFLLKIAVELVLQVVELLFIAVIRICYLLLPSTCLLAAGAQGLVLPLLSEVRLHVDSVYKLHHLDFTGLGLQLSRDDELLIVVVRDSLELEEEAL